MADKPNLEGVALDINDTPDRYAEGVSVAVPEDDSTPEPKPGQKAESPKEK